MTRQLLIGVALMALAACAPGQPDESAPATARPTASPFDVSALLPVSRSELKETAQLAARFAATADTWRYDEAPGDYLARLRPMATGDLYGELARAALTRNKRKVAHEIATAEARPYRIRDLASRTVTFLVRVRQTITSTTGTTTPVRELAVTTVRDGQWRVHSLQPAQTGNSGENPDAGS